MEGLQIHPQPDGTVSLNFKNGAGAEDTLWLDKGTLAKILEATTHKDALHVLPALQAFLDEGRPKIQPLWGYVTGVKALVDQERIAQATRAGLDLAHEMQAAMAAAHNDLADGILAAKAAYAGRDPYESQPRA